MNDETWNHLWQQIASFVISVWTLPEIFVPARRYEQMFDTLNNPASFDLSICQFPQVSWQLKESIEAGEIGELLPLSESGLERSKFKLLTWLCLSCPNYCFSHNRLSMSMACCQQETCIWRRQLKDCCLKSDRLIQSDQQKRIDCHVVKSGVDSACNKGFLNFLRHFDPRLSATADV